MSKCLVLFELIFWFWLLSLSSQSVFVIKFACFDLAAKFSAVSLLNSVIVICLSWSWPESFFSILLTFVAFYSLFLTKLLTSGTLFSTTVNAAFVSKPLLIGILFSISLILAL